MKKSVEELSKWMDMLKEFSMPSWDQLPEMDLYMDQVMSYLQKKLEPTLVEDIEKMITPFMINNYVKANLITPPVQKKYTREQVGYLFGVCSVKQILSINDILFLFEKDKDISNEKDKLYTFFKNVQDHTLHEAEDLIDSKIKIIEKRYTEEINRANGDEQQIKKADIFAESNLCSLAFRLAIEAEVKKIIADRILTSLQRENPPKITPVETANIPTTRKEIKRARKAQKKAVKREAKSKAKATN